MTIPPLDKQAHFWLGGFIVGAVSPINLPTAFLLCVLIGALKEWWWDAEGHGTVDRFDFIATLAGGLAMAVWLFALSLAQSHLS